MVSLILISFAALAARLRSRACYSRIKSAAPAPFSSSFILGAACASGNKKGPREGLRIRAEKLGWLSGHPAPRRARYENEKHDFPTKMTARTLHGALRSVNGQKVERVAPRARGKKAKGARTKGARTKEENTASGRQERARARGAHLRVFQSKIRNR